MTKILERENYSNGYRLSVVSSTDLLCDVIYKHSPRFDNWVKHILTNKNRNMATFNSLHKTTELGKLPPFYKRWSNAMVQYRNELLSPPR